MLTNDAIDRRLVICVFRPLEAQQSLLFSASTTAKQGKTFARVDFPYLFSIFRSKNNRRLTVFQAIVVDDRRAHKQSRNANNALNEILQAAISKQRCKLCAEARSKREKKISNAIQILVAFDFAICVDIIKIESTRSKNHEIFIQNHSLINKVCTSNDAMFFE